jgi:hypothetical protein
MYCTQCGTKNPAGSRFCAQCGTQLNTQADVTTGVLQTAPPEMTEVGSELIDVEAIRSDLSPGTALLVAVRGPNVGAKFLLDKPVVSVGRHPESDIFLDDITVSRRHAEFRLAGDRVVVADAGSLNGTYVNGTRSDELELSNGDDVQVGKFRLRALIPPKATRPAAADGQG